MSVKLEGVDAAKALADRISASVRIFPGNQSDFAEEADISRASVTNYTKGIRTPDAITLLRIADVCGVDPTWLFTGVGSMLKTKPASQRDQSVSPDGTLVVGEPDVTYGGSPNHSLQTQIEMPDGSRVVARLGLWVETEE